MIPIEFPEQNFTFLKPENMTDEQCSSLSVFRGKNIEGSPVIVSKWLPNKEDIEAIARGEAIYLEVAGSIMLPVSIYTENPFVAAISE